MAKIPAIIAKRAATPLFEIKELAADEGVEEAVELAAEVGTELAAELGVLEVAVAIPVALAPLETPVADPEEVAEAPDDVTVAELVSVEDRLIERELDVVTGLVAVAGGGKKSEAEHKK
jgi:hypothetical protein